MKYMVHMIDHRERGMNKYHLAKTLESLLLG